MPDQTRPDSTPERPSGNRDNRQPAYPSSTVSNAGSAGVTGKTEASPTYSMSRWQSSSDGPYQPGSPQESFEERFRRLEALARAIAGDR